MFLGLELQVVFRFSVELLDGAWSIWAKKDMTKSMNLNGTIEMVGRQEIECQHGPSRPAQ